MAEDSSIQERNVQAGFERSGTGSPFDLLAPDAEGAMRDLNQDPRRQNPFHS
jgi:hypothetical protein